MAQTSLTSLVIGWGLAAVPFVVAAGAALAGSKW
jgi:hypothetical protein